MTKKGQKKVRFCRRKVYIEPSKRGFTMVELLAVIVILGILTTLVILSFSNLTERSREEYYNSQEDMLILAAQEYFADYRSRLPKNIGEVVSVTVQTLVSLDYIDEVMSYENELCDLENSEVKVLKVSDKEYQYEVSLICDSYQTKDQTIDPNNSVPGVTIRSSITGDVGYRIYKEESKTVSELQNGNKVLQFNFTLTSKNGTISSYQYSIRKEGQNSDYFQSAVISGNGQNEMTGNITVRPEGASTIAEDGRYILTIEVTDSNGNTTVKSSPDVEIDNTPPDCGLTAEDRDDNLTDVRFQIHYSSDVSSSEWYEKSWLTNEPQEYNKSTINNNIVTMKGLGYNRGLLRTYDLSGNYCEVDTKVYAVVLDSPTIDRDEGWTNAEKTNLEPESDDEDYISRWQVNCGDGWKNISNSAKKAKVTHSITTADNTVMNTTCQFRVCLNDTDDSLCSASVSTEVKVDRVDPVVQDYSYYYHGDLDAVATSTPSSQCWVNIDNTVSFKNRTFSVDFSNIKSYDNDSGIEAIRIVLSPTYHVSNGIDDTISFSCNHGATCNAPLQNGSLAIYYLKRGINQKTYIDNNTYNYNLNMSLDTYNSFYNRYMIDWCVAVQAVDEAGNLGQLSDGPSGVCGLDHKQLVSSNIKDLQESRCTNR